VSISSKLHLSYTFRDLKTDNFHKTSVNSKVKKKQNKKKTSKKLCTPYFTVVLSDTCLLCCFECGRKRALSLMATLLLFIIGLLPLSCHHSECFVSQGIVLWESREADWLWLLGSVALCHAACAALFYCLFC